MSEASYPVLIRAMRMESPTVMSYELSPEEGVALPVFLPGDHVDVRVPGGPRRSYSLISRASDGAGYEIAVKREAASRGGSAWLHEQARVGSRLEIAAPSGGFALVEDAPHSVLIAGGIGITPLLAMAERLTALGRPWDLHYSARASEDLVFRRRVEALAAAGRGQVRLYVSGAGEPMAARMALPEIVRGADAATHLYCCGPNGMIDAFLAAGSGRAPQTMHCERFAAAEQAATAGGFTVELARTGKSVRVAAGQTLLEVLLDAGVDVPYACGQGVCGSCQTRVLEGEPDHRDSVLTEQERAANECILVCCSGARSQRLVLDL